MSSDVSAPDPLPEQPPAAGLAAPHQAQASGGALNANWGLLRTVIDEGVAKGSFSPSNAAKSVLRLAALMDGLAVQLALNEPGMTARKFTELWWESAVLELGITEPAKRRKSSR